MKSYTTIKKELLRDKRTKKAYEDLGPEFELIQAIIRERIKRGVTQAQLAKKMGTKQSAISRLERGTHNPSLSFLRKLAKALNCDLHISFS